VAFSELRQGFAKTGTGDFQVMYGDKEPAEAGSPMGAGSVGPADLLMLKLVSSKTAIPSVSKAEPMDGADSVSQGDGAMGIVFSAAASPSVIGVTMKMASLKIASARRSSAWGTL
jgi:hypothetical protein